jgi:acyl-CoA synthetase (AMP-forming)/AMP-acid ligase II
LDPAWKRKAEAFYGVALQNGYGMTETTAGISVTSNAIGNADISAGPPLPGIELKIVPTAGSEATGEGEILTRGPHVMLGYFNNPEETNKIIDEDGYLLTGDIGRVDKQGRLHICGRCKELIIRSGFNVYPPEVEAAISDHPDVVQSAVIGRLNNDGNEDVLAFVQRAVGSAIDADVLRAFLLERLTAYKCPTHIMFVDALPAAASGKILKHRLLDEFSELLSRVH